MDKIEKHESIHLLDKYVNYLKKSLSDRVINMYANYISEQVKTASDRKGYRELALYLKKISDCPNGKETAVCIVMPLIILTVF